MADKAYSWDETVENPNEGEFTLLPDGDYPFEVTKLERGRHEGGSNSKVPACFKATVHLRVDGGDHGVTTIQRILFLHSKFDWLLCQFFAALGHRKHGEPLRMDWERVVGSRGMVRVSTRDYTTDKGEQRQANDVDRFIDPQDTPTPPTPAATQTPPAEEEEEAIPF